MEYKANLIKFICFATITISCIGQSRTKSTTAVVHSRLGTIVGSTVETSFLGKQGTVQRYLGIPYAESPTGDRRFRKPVTKGKLTSPYNATEFGPACPQDLGMLAYWVPGYPYEDEDCLSLNVFVPGNANTSQTGSGGQGLAVMVWLYGGAYVIGQSKMYSAENLTLVGDVIVVTLNYRVTSLGFLTTGSEKFPGNLGLWDQRLALQWVHEYIGDFGGDPARVTIFGESAGASSVLYQSLYADNRGLFQRIISESGSPLCPWAYQPTPLKFTRRLADRLGCTDPDLDTAVTCLQGLDPMAIVNNSRVGTVEETAYRAEWLPTYDGVMVKTDQPGLFNVNGSQSLDFFKDLDAMIGVNNNDGAVLALLALEPFMVKQLNKTFQDGIQHSFFTDVYIPMFLRDLYGHNLTSQLLQNWVSFIYTDYKSDHLHNDHVTLAKFLEFTGDGNFFMPALAALRAHEHASIQSKSKASSFLYEFTVRPSYSHVASYVGGAYHGDELPFVFGFPDLMAEGMKYKTGGVTNQEKQLSLQMMTLWTNFAKSGNPNAPVPVGESIVWPDYNLDSQRYLHFGQNQTTVSQNLFADRTAFWLDLAPRLLSLGGDTSLAQQHVTPTTSNHVPFVPVG